MGTGEQFDDQEPNSKYDVWIGLAIIVGLILGALWI